jgi:hypothetical protein
MICNKVLGEQVNKTFTFILVHLMKLTSMREAKVTDYLSVILYTSPGLYVETPATNRLSQGTVS